MVVACQELSSLVVAVLWDSGQSLSALNLLTSVRQWKSADPGVPAIFHRQRSGAGPGAPPGFCGDAVSQDGGTRPCVL